MHPDKQCPGSYFYDDFDLVPNDHIFLLDSYNNVVRTFLEI